MDRISGVFLCLLSNAIAIFGLGDWESESISSLKQIGVLISAKVYLSMKFNEK